VSTFGRLDVVISNAGWTRVTNFSNLDEGLEDEDWDRCLLYNVKSHLWLMHAAKPYLEESEGAFVTTASVAGVKPSGSSLPYAVTKAAAIHLSKALAVICSPRIRVNSVSPGLLLTEWGLKFGEEKINAATQATKLKRLATVEVSWSIS
jgi:NAD(P)-dependent dehydrogenase (short-subunit alcohol dehydrogenase family)